MEAIQNLWEESGKAALKILRNKGLADNTIKEANLGYNLRDLFLDRESWGLPPEIKENGKLKKLWLPAGIVIPLIENNQVIRLRFRRLEGEPRYYLLPGSNIRPMTWNIDSKVLIIIESELDGLLLNQEAGDLVGVVALGSAASKPDKITRDALMHADLILVALDADEAGAKASWSFWPETYGTKVKRWPCIMGKDPSDAWKNGLNIRAWVIAGISDTIDRSKTTMESGNHTPQEITQTPPILEVRQETKHTQRAIIPFSSYWLNKYSEEQLERLAIMTVYGGLSDNEAIANILA